MFGRFCRVAKHPLHGCLVFISLMTTPAFAAGPQLAIIIDDLGHRPVEGHRAVALPGTVAVAVLPHTPHGEKLARAAHAAGKEVLLHLPLEPVDEECLMGPGSLWLDMTREEFSRTLQENLDAVPYAVGVNNHMGSLLTRHPGHMGWLMGALSDQDLFFVDSYTTNASVALATADEHGVSAVRRDIFLDRNSDIEAIRAQLATALERARRTGSVLIIGHPYPETLGVLETALPELEAQGFELVTVAGLIEHRRGSK